MRTKVGVRTCKTQSTQQKLGKQKVRKKGKVQILTNHKTHSQSA